MFDQAFFGLTALISLVLAATLLWQYPQRKHIHGLLWGIAAIIFFLAALLLAINGLAILGDPYVPIIAALIPAFFASGIIFAAFKNRVWGNIYVAYVLVVLLVLAVAKLSNLGAVATPVLIAIHAPSGIIIFLIPLITAFTKRTSITSSLVGLGGLLIGIGGVALATLAAGAPLLPAALVVDIIAPLLFVVALLFAIGILATPGWGLKETA